MFRRFWWMLLVMVPVGMTAGWLLSAVVTYITPKKYESSALIEVKTWTSSNASYPHPPTNSGGLATELEIMKSRKSLSKVIDSLDLVNRWRVDPESALMILKSIVKTEHPKGTDLIEIRVRHTNKLDARDIVLETVRAYKDYRQDLASTQSENLTNELRKTSRDLEDKIEDLRKILVTIVRTKGVDGGSDPADRQVYADTKRDIETELSFLEQLKLKMLAEEISSKIPAYNVVIHEDPVIANTPIFPNVTLNLVRGSVFGALLSPFFALPLMAFMNRKPVVVAP